VAVIAASKAAMAPSPLSTVWFALAPGDDRTNPLRSILEPLLRAKLAGPLDERLRGRALTGLHRPQIALGPADPAGEAARGQVHRFADYPHTVWRHGCGIAAECAHANGRREVRPRGSVCQLRARDGCGPGLLSGR
jgi:hypothetical protein